MAAGLGTNSIGDASVCDCFGLNDKPFSELLTASIGWKHWASGLNVLVTSRSAFSSERKSLISENRIFTAPFSPMRYETSPGSTHTDNSAGRFSSISLIDMPLSRAARNNTVSIGSPVFKHRNAEPCKRSIIIMID